MKRTIFLVLILFLYSNFLLAQKNFGLLGGGISVPFGNASENDLISNSTQSNFGYSLELTYGRQIWKKGGFLVSISTFSINLDQSDLKEIDRTDPSLIFLKYPDNTLRNYSLLAGIFHDFSIGKKEKFSVGLKGQAGVLWAETISTRYIQETATASQQIVSYSGGTSASFGFELGGNLKYRISENFFLRISADYFGGFSNNEVQTLDLPIGNQNNFSEEIDIQILKIQIGAGYGF